ncbi:MAG: N-acetylmuramoyl-L-alanine amidase [Thermoleophilia bacterium]
MRGKKKYLLGTAAVVLVMMAAVLFLPGYSGQALPPETIGGDAVYAGAGFEAGELNGTGVSTAAGTGELALALQPSRSRGEYVSEPEETEYSFNALGLHWKADLPEGARVDAEVRFSQDGTSWGDWIKVNIDDPDLPDHVGDTKTAGETIGQLAFADEAKHFQYRLILQGNAAGESPAVTRLTASYIDAKGYHESPLSVDKVTRLAGAALSPDEASAAPAVISRAQWGANEAYMTWSPEYQPVKKIIIHHTVTSNSDPDPAATVRSIYYYHAVSLGWGDIGYNFLIDRQGRIYEGRYGGNAVVGGHALTWNPGSVGVAALGNYEESDITTAMYNAFVELMVWKSNANRVAPWGNDYLNGTYSPNYLGHRDVGSTACPGRYLYAHLNGFRNDANARYSPIPITTPFIEKWDALNGAPGGAIIEQYPVTGGKAQDFQTGRLIWNQSFNNTYWVVGAILSRYDSFGKWDSFLGLPTSDEYGAGSGRVSDFEHGQIYWSAATDAREVHGGILAKYIAAGGPWRFGFPTSDEYDVPDRPGSKESDFQLARVYYRNDGGGTFITYGAILGRYLAWGGPAALGLPASDEYDLAGVSGGRVTDFDHGRIYWTQATDAHAIWTGPFYDKFMSLGGPTGTFGLPVDDDFVASNGRAQNLQRAIMTWQSSLGAHVVYGGIRGKYNLMGGPTGYLGLATTDEMDVPGISGARESDFQNGRIFWHASTGEHSVIGGINQLYTALGGSPVLGIPASDEFDLPSVAGGRESDFSMGRIYYHPTAGTHEVYGGILARYLELGGPSGIMGMPVTGETDVSGVTGARESDFQNGRIYWSSSTGEHAVYGGILIKYVEYGGPVSALGLPVTEEYAYGSGRRSDFQGGFIYWDATVGAQVYVGTATTVTADSTYEARDASNNLLGTIAAGQTASVRYSGGIYSLQAPGVFYSGSSYIRFVASAGIMQVSSYHDVPGWNPSLDDNKFRGTIEVRYSPVSSKVWVVNELPVEHYMKGIAETSSGTPADFLKTMTVAARSYAIWHLDRGGKYGASEIFHLKNSRNGNGDDQVYKGYGLEARFPELVSAVNGTAGQVVKYNGSVAMTSYFSNSDGRTRSAQEVWGVDYWPWLQSVPDPDCNGMSLNGHGVGLSGTGALARAGRGDSYSAILGYYYTSTAVSPVNTARNIRIAITSVS